MDYIAVFFIGFAAGALGVGYGLWWIGKGV